MDQQCPMRTLWGLALIIAALTLTPAAFAQNGGMMGGHMMGGNMMSGNAPMMNRSMPMMGGGCPMYGMGMMQGGMAGVMPGHMMGMGMMPGTMMGGMGMMSSHMMGGMGMPGMSGNLALSDKQQSDMRKSREQLWNQQWELMRQMHTQHAKLYDLYSEEEPDVKALMNQYREINKLQLQMMENKLNAQQQMRKSLTKEQREKMSQMGMWMRGGW